MSRPPITLYALIAGLLIAGTCSAADSTLVTSSVLVQAQEAFSAKDYDAAWVIFTAHSGDFEAGIRAVDLDLLEWLMKRCYKEYGMSYGSAFLSLSRAAQTIYCLDPKTDPIGYAKFLLSGLMPTTLNGFWLEQFKRISEDEQIPRELRDRALLQVAEIHLNAWDYVRAEENCSLLLKSHYGELRGAAHFLLAKLHRGEGEYRMMRDRLRLAISSGYTNEVVTEFATETQHLGPSMVVPYDFHFKAWGERPSCGGLILNTVMAFSGDKYLYRTNGIVCQEGSINAFSGHAVGYRLPGANEGRRLWEGDFVDGVEHGRSSWWYRDGGKMGEGVYTSGKPDGEFVSWWPEGTTNCVTVYNRGVKLGTKGRRLRDGSPIKHIWLRTSARGEDARIRAERDESRLTNLVVSIGADVMSVPSREFKDATDPQLYSIRFGLCSNDVNRSFVSVTCFITNASTSRRQPQDLQFFFDSGQYERVQLSPTAITKEDLTEQSTAE